MAKHPVKAFEAAFTSPLGSATANAVQIGGGAVAGAAYADQKRTNKTVKLHGQHPAVRKAPGSTKKGYPSK